MVKNVKQTRFFRVCFITMKLKCPLKLEAIVVNEQFIAMISDETDNF